MINKLRYKEHQNRMQRLKRVQRQPLISEEFANVSHVVYVMETVKVCGGVKIILQHAEQLVKQGIKVTLVAHYPLPTWFSVKADYVQVPFGIEMATGIPECDLIIANYYKHIHSCIETGIAPVVYFEQGDFHLFEFDKLDVVTRAFVFRQYQLPQFILTVSHRAAEFIKRFYGREAKVIPIAIDQSIFNTETLAFQWHKPYILMMGLEETFKCIEDIIAAVDLLKAENPNIEVDLLWITPEPPKSTHYRNVGQIFINPPQAQIASLYRGALLFVSASQYESFSLPVLEAMSCDCPVVTTRNAGVLEYAEDNVNTVLANINDVDDLSNKIQSVLTDADISQKIRQKGLKTARKFSWEYTTQRILDYYNQCSSHRVVYKSKLEDWDLDIQENNLVNPEEYHKLITLILNSEGDIIQVPTLNNLIQGLEIARWDTVAVRKIRNNSQIEHFLIYVYGDNKPSESYRDAYERFKLQRYSDALSLFTEKFKNEEDSNTRAIYAKWMVLSLIGLGKNNDALKLVHDFLAVYDECIDLYFLLNYIHFIEHGTTKQEYQDIISLIGEAAGYPEYLYNIR